MTELMNKPDSKPNPDPTKLTTEQLERGMAGLREIIEARLNGNDRSITERWAMIDRELVYIQKQLDGRKQAIVDEVSHLSKLHEEKFSSIQTQFSERDTRTDQAASTTKVAVDAALQAQKEAVGEQNKSSALAIAKSEAATTKQIDAIGLQSAATNKATDEKIDDLKDRMSVMDGRKGGMSDGLALLLGIATLISIVTSIGAVVFAAKTAKDASTAPQAVSYYPSPPSPLKAP